MNSLRPRSASLGFFLHVLAERRLWRNLAIVLLTGALLGSLLTPILGTQPINFGIWKQSEPVLIGIFFFATVAALALSILIAIGSPLAGSLLHPIVLTAMALALWSAGIGIYRGNLGSTIFGSPELGEGVLWFLSLAILTAAAAAVRRMRLPALYIAATSLLVTTIIAIATVFYLSGIGNIPVPLFFADYLAFSGLYAGVAGFVLLRHRHAFWRLIAVTTGAAVIATSGNNVANLAVFAAVGAVCCLWLISRFGGQGSYRSIAAGMSVAAVVSISALVATVDVPSLMEKFSDDDFQVQLNKGGMLSGPLNSVISRQNLLDIAAKQLSADPSILLHGDGWGRFSNMFTAQLPVEWVTLRDDNDFWDDEKELLVTGWWDAVNRVDFHSHNSFVQAILAAGIPGGFMYLMLFLWLPLAGRKELGLLPAFVSLASAMTATLWFQMPGNLPLMAVCWGVLISSPSRFYAPHRKWRLMMSGGTGLAGLLLAFATGWLIYFVPMAFSFSPSLTSPLYSKGLRQTCITPYDDMGRGGQHLGFRLGTLVNSSREKILEGRDPEIHMIEVLRGLTCAAEQYLDQGGAGLQLMAVTLNERTELAFLERPQNISNIYDGLRTSWRARLDTFLRQAPGRTDMAIPYLLDRLSAGDDIEVANFSASLYAMNANDPVAQWFSGLMALGRQGEQGRGLERMRLALAGGIERLMPVDPTIKDQLLPGIKNKASTGHELTIRSGNGISTYEVATGNGNKEHFLKMTSRMSMPKLVGMVFYAQDAGRVEISLNHTMVSYDLLFIDPDGHIANIISSTKPRSKKLLVVEGDTSTVVWLNAGTVAREGIAPGDNILIR
jgi:uncharacterized membrane protein (UPF0127 family)